MFSLHTLRSPDKAFSYYCEPGEYYLEARDKERSLWLGKGAALLGLKEQVGAKDFKALLEGYLPTGEVMTQAQKGGYHRPGYDLTFSAPKSVSILALVGANQTVLQAYREAVGQTLEYIEQHYGRCRNKKQNQIEIETTGNLTIASFEQKESRSGDPGLHIHCVVMNVTQRMDKAWRTLFFDEVYRDQRFLGRVCDAFLAQNLMKLGYELEIKQDGNFEIKGVSEALIQGFSKRRAQIEEWLSAQSLKGARAAEFANFITRPSKNTQSAGDLLNHWLKELEQFGVSLESLQALEREAEARGPVPLPDASMVAKQAVSSALHHLSERNTHFSFQRLVKSAQLLSLLPTNEGELLQAIEARIEDKTLIYLENKLLTTKAIFELGEKNNALVVQGKERVYKILPEWIAAIQTRSLNPCQQQALKTLLTSNDRQILLHSNSAVALKQSLKTLVELTSTQGFYPRLLTQRQFEVEPLKKYFQTDRVHTLEGFLLACEERTFKRGEARSVLERWDRRIKKAKARDIWILQGEISTKQLNVLGEYAEQLGARLILAHSKSVTAFLELKGITRIEIKAKGSEVERLNHQDALLMKCEALEQKVSLQESANPRESAVSAYQAGDLLLCLTTLEKMVLNAQVRALLQQVGQLSQRGELSLSILRPLNFSQAEKRSLHFYQPQDVLRFNRGLREEMEPQYFEVVSVDLASQQMTLQREGSTLVWDPKQTPLKQLEVFKPETRSVQIGDILAWTRSIRHESNRGLNQIRGEQAKVTAVSSEQISVQLANGQTLHLKTSSRCSQHWDYGYSLSLNEAHLNASQKIIGVLNKMDAQSLPLLNAALDKIELEKIPVQFFCESLAQLKQSIHHCNTVDKPLEAVYDRAEALENYQNLATQPLFNRLQSAFLKANQLNPEFKSNALNAEPEPPVSPELRAAIEALDKAAIYHSEREAVISLDTLMGDALRLGGIGFSILEVKQAIDLATQKGWLVGVGENDAGQTLVTAKHTLSLEKLCIESRKQGQNTLKPILDQDAKELQAVLTHPRLTVGQKEAIQLILTTRDRIVAVQGIAGSGKTTALKEIKRLCEDQGFKTTVLANMASAKNQAKLKSQMEASTTAQFLVRMETALDKDLNRAKAEFGGQQVYIVDESSMASTNDAFRTQRIIERLEARLVWTGDFKQQGSMGSGLQFHDTLAYGVARAVMRENVRLSDNTAIQAMKQAYQGNMAGAIQSLKDRIEEIPIKEQALNRIVEAYFEYSPQNPELLVIIPLNKDRQRVNDLIREKLKEQDTLSKQGVKCEVLLPTDKRESDKINAANYQLNEVIRFNIHHPRLGVQAGDYAEVAAIDLTHQRLTLKLNDKLIYWSPKDLTKPSHVEVYQKASREISINDLLVFKRNQEHQGIFNSDRARVLKIEGNLIEVCLTNHQTTTLDLSQRQNCHLEYGYALTAYAAQGREATVIAYLEGPKTIERTGSQLKRGDKVILSAEKEGQYAIVARIIQIENDKMVLRDRCSQYHEVKWNPQDRWECFPSFEQRKSYHLPLSTSQQAFISDITRGDKLLLVVPNIEDLQKTLERHHTPKRSALSYQDPNWQRLHQAVNRLVANIAAREKTLKSHSQEASLKKAERSLTNGRSIDVKPKQFNVNPEEIEWRLQKDLLGYATEWLGSPQNVSEQEAHWKGGLTLTLQGPQKGCWRHGLSGEGGKGLISLYRAAFEIDRKTAIKNLSERLGLSEREKGEKETFKFKEIREQSKERQMSREEKTKYAQAFYDKGKPIIGTLAETYLKVHRGIQGELLKDFKFIERAWHFETREYTPALLAPIKNKEEDFTGVVRIFLNSDGNKYDKIFMNEMGKAEQAVSKANLGFVGGGAVVVQKGKDPSTVFVAEGVESALSVAQSNSNYQVLASLSVNQFKNLSIGSEVQKIIICADRVEANFQTPKAVIEAIGHHLSQGRQVFVALPFEVPKGVDKYDFNDLLKEGGIAAVQHALEQRIEIKDAQALEAQQRLTKMIIIESPQEKVLKNDNKNPDKCNNEGLSQYKSVKEMER